MPALQEEINQRDRHLNLPDASVDMNGVCYNGRMRINFYDDPFQEPRERGEVRFEQLGFFVYPDKRRVAVGFQLTPFRERPSIEVRIWNDNGEPAGELLVIEVLQTNFSLTIHLRDQEPTTIYRVEAVLYFKGDPDTEREVVHFVSTPFDMNVSADQLADLEDQEG